MFTLAHLWCRLCWPFVRKRHLCDSLRGVTGEVCATCVWQFKCYLKIDNDAVKEDECGLLFTQCGNYLSLHCQSYKWYFTLDANEMMGDIGAYYAIVGRSNVTHIH